MPDLTRSAELAEVLDAVAEDYPGASPEFIHTLATECLKTWGYYPTPGEAFPPGHIAGAVLLASELLETIGQESADGN